MAGLLYALEHHPDHPDRPRGDVGRGARDPLRVIGARLRPWTGRLRELPFFAVGHPSGDTLDRQSRPQAWQPTIDVALLDRPAGRRAREAAREALSAHLAELRRRRSGDVANS